MITGNEPAFPFERENEKTVTASDFTGLTILQHTTIEMAKAIVTGLMSNEEMAKAVSSAARQKGVSPEDHISQSALLQAQSIIKVLNQ
jgi:hypothetical protein